MIFDLDSINNLKILALRSVIRPDEEYLCRKIIRWYSKTFHTPIIEVQKIPILDILQHYYEEQFEELEADPEKKEEFHNIITELIETESQKADRLKKEAKENIDDEVFLKQVADKIREQESLNLLKQEGKVPIRDTTNKISEMPEISMDFNNLNSDIEKEYKEVKDEGFGLLTPSKNKNSSNL